MSKFYKPGDVIYSGKPFAQVVYYEQRTFYCDNCFQLSMGIFSKLKACSSCKYVYYCGKPCQRAAWNRHKLECPLLCNLQEGRKDFVRLIGQVILLVKGKDWKSISEPVGSVEKSFHDLVSNTEYTKDDPKLCLHGLEVLSLVKWYLGELNAFTDDETLEIIGKVKHNRFGVGPGSALYLGASLFDHACIPNADRSCKGTTMIIRAITQVSRDDVKKVTISYGDLLYTDEFSKINQTFYGPCKCDDCSLPYGESKLTKILDKTRAWGVLECTEEALEALNTIEILGGSIAPNKLFCIKELLKQHKNVLGDTNLFHMKLLIKKAFFEKNVSEKIKDYKEAAECVEKTFGENSFQLLCIYKSLSVLRHREAEIYAEKERKLSALLGLNE